MKTLKILVLTIIVAGFVGITQTQAQAYLERGEYLREVMYEVDGVQYAALVNVDYQFELTPSAIFNCVAKGNIYEVWKWDPDDPAALYGGWVLLSDMVFPSSAVVKYVEVSWAPGFYDKITITPSGKVTVVTQIKF